MQKLRIKRQSDCIWSGTIHLGHPYIRRPLIRSICRSKHRNRGNSKLFGRITVIVFNVPSHIIYHFQKFSKIRGATPLAGYHPIHQIWACAHLFGTLINSICIISFYFWWQYLKQIFFKIQNFFYIFWKVWTTNTPFLNSWVVEAYISIRLKNGYTPEEKHG